MEDFLKFISRPKAVALADLIHKFTGARAFSLVDSALEKKYIRKVSIGIHYNYVLTNEGKSYLKKKQEHRDRVKKFLR